MSWQDELRQLDLDLATGRVSEIEYWRRREELFSNTNQAAQTQPTSGNPFSPPWSSQPVNQPYSGDSTATQVTGPSASPWQANAYPQQAYSGLGEQIWSPGPAAPAFADQVTDQYPVTSRRKRSRKEFINAGLAMVLLAGFIVLVAYWLGGGHFGRDNPAQQSAGQATQSAPSDPLLADVPGEPQVGVTSKVKNWSDVPGLGLLSTGSPSETTVYQSSNPADAHLALTKQGFNTIQVLVVHEPNANAAKQVRDQLGALPTAPGQHRIDAQGGVFAFANDSGSDQARITRLAYYSSGDYVVRIQVTGLDVFTVQQQFQVILSTQLRTLHADS